MSRAYFAPTSVEDAVRLLGEHPEAQPIAGGTDLVVGTRQGKRELPQALVAIHAIAGLGGIDQRDGGLVIGALASHDAIERSAAVRERFAALADASAIVGSPATRNLGTLGGNLANASPAMETGGPLIVHGAEIELRGPDGSRRLSVEEYLLGPGQTAGRPGELIVAVHLPAPAPRSGSAYVRLEYRRSMEIAVVGASALVALADDGTIAEARVALTAVAPTIIRSAPAEKALRGREPVSETLAAAAAAAGEPAAPISDVRGSDRYRRAQIAVITRRAIAYAVRRARGEDVPVPATLTQTWGEADGGAR